MLAVAAQFTRVAPGLFTWQVFSPEHRCELSSTAVRAGARLYLFDPVPLEEAARAALLQRGAAPVVVLTNANHERAAAWWRDATGAQVWADAAAPLGLSGVRRFAPRAGQWEGWQLHRLPGGPPGEIALRRPELSLVVLGDAVYDLPQYGFGVLPEKYCADRPRLLAALRQLAEHPFERAALAHGGVLQPAAAHRLAQVCAHGADCGG